MSLDSRQKNQLKFTLKGWAANSNLRAQGYAFLAYSPDEAREYLASKTDKKSFILVCPGIDWSWSDIANEVAGVVSDHGTRVSRGSEVSGIVQVPAVLGTEVATKKIKDGNFLQIICDGNEAIAKVYD